MSLRYAEIITPWIIDSVHFMNDAYDNGKKRSSPRGGEGERVEG